MRNKIIKIVKNYKSFSLSTQEKYACAGLSVFFTFCMIFGSAFDADNSWTPVFAMPWNSICRAILWLVFFTIMVTAIWKLWNYWASKNKSVSMAAGRHAVFFNKHPFWITFFIIFLSYIPYFIAFYPGILMGDSVDQILQGFNLPDYTSAHLNLLNPSLYLNQHHPVIHTLLLTTMLRIGKAFWGSYQTGLFIYAMLQSITMICAFSYVIEDLTERNFPIQGRILLILYFILAPRIQNYMFLISKDVLYTAWLLVFLISYMHILEGEEKDEIKSNLFWFSAIGILSFRNDGKYVLLSTMLVGIALIKKVRPYLVITLSFAMIVTIILSNTFTSVKITPPSPREMLSIPFQQTARYVSTYPEEVTEEEKECIKKVLDYDVLLTDYIPGNADPVKDSFKKTATKEDLLNYFVTWGEMLGKHPGVYVQASMNNLYEYFYPGASTCMRYTEEFSIQKMNELNKQGVSVGLHFSFPENTHWLRQLYEAWDFIFLIPGLSLFTTPAFYTWIVLFMIVYWIIKKGKENLALTVPLGVILLICLAGPCNGWYFRYLFPIYVCIFPLICIFFCKKQNYKP